MTIDWITVAAQVINFLVLVWLLQRFLYGPITRAISRREAEIGERLDEAAESRRAAEEDAENLRRDRRQLEEERQALLAAAREESAEIRHTLENEARANVAALREAWERDVESDRDAFVRNMRASAARQFLVLAREALSGLTGESLNAAMCGRFAETLRSIPAGERTMLSEAASGHDGPIQVVSSFEMTAEQKAHVHSAIIETIVPDAQVVFSSEERIILGIEMVAGGQTVSWSIERYLAGLEQRIQRDLDAGLAGAIRDQGA